MKRLLAALVILLLPGCADFTTRAHGEKYICMPRKGSRMFVNADGSTIIYRVFGEDRKEPLPD